MSNQGYKKGSVLYDRNCNQWIEIVGRYDSISYICSVSYIDEDLDFNIYPHVVIYERDLNYMEVVK